MLNAFLIAMKNHLFVVAFLCLISYGSLIPINHKLSTYRSIFKNVGALESSTGCTVCKGLVEVLHGIGSTGIGKGELVDIVTKICLKLRIPEVDSRVCETVTGEFGDELWFVIIDAAVEPDKICGWIFGDSCFHYVDFFAPWNITLPPRSYLPKDSWRNQVMVIFNLNCFYVQSNIIISQPHYFQFFSSYHHVIIKAC